jgi:hypothetical protein
MENYIENKNKELTILKIYFTVFIKKLKNKLVNKEKSK